MFDFVSHRKIFFIISGVLLGVSVLSLLIFGLKPGIDFTGGSMMEIDYLGARLPSSATLVDDDPAIYPLLSQDTPLSSQEETRDKIPSSDMIKQSLKDLGLKEVKVQATGKTGYILRFRDVDENTHQEILSVLGDPEEVRFESIGPVIGKELTRKAQWAIVLALIAIIIYIVWAFRKISKIAKKGESWRYGLGALLALFHDVLILLGFFALMGYFKGVEVNTAFITAILTVLGYSVNDTIVIYDRIRENLLTHTFRSMESAINVSLNENIVRSLNTSITTIFVLLVIYLFGGASIQNFVLAMMVGIGIGTYSSIAIASQFLLFKRAK